MRSKVLPCRHIGKHGRRWKTSDSRMVPAVSARSARKREPIKSAWFRTYRQCPPGLFSSGRIGFHRPVRGGDFLIPTPGVKPPSRPLYCLSVPARIASANMPPYDIAPLAWIARRSARILRIRSAGIRVRPNDRSLRPDLGCLPSLPLT